MQKLQRMLGFDRLSATLSATPGSRAVIAFPKTAKSTCLMVEIRAGWTLTGINRPA